MTAEAIALLREDAAAPSDYGKWRREKLLPALDSLEAEVELLREEGNIFLRNCREKDAEVERLTKERDGAHEALELRLIERDDARAEVERLTKERGWWQTTCEAWHEAADDCRSRLQGQAEIADKAWALCDKAKAENERLRAVVEAGKGLAKRTVIRDNFADQPALDAWDAALAKLTEEEGGEKT